MIAIVVMVLMLIMIIIHNGEIKQKPSYKPCSIENDLEIMHKLEHYGRIIVNLIIAIVFVHACRLTFGHLMLRQRNLKRKPPTILNDH
jgi:hypothetical protein